MDTKTTLVTIRAWKPRCKIISGERKLLKECNKNLEYCPNLNQKCKILNIAKRQSRTTESTCQFNILLTYRALIMIIIMHF